jgi:DNA-binding MarR family transcriptional regulator
MTIDPLLLPRNISSNRLKILACLWDAQEAGAQLNLTQLAKRLKVSTAAVSDHLFRLDQDGLVVRTQSKKDRRKEWYALSKTGVALCETWYRIP